MHEIKKLVFGFAAATAVFVAHAATNTWVNGATGGWNDPNSWDGGVPTASSIVTVPEGATMPVGDDDMALATTVAEIYLAASNSVVQFDFESTYTMTGLVRGNGKIVKNGTGTLNLSNETVDGYYAKQGMDVNNGIVQCPDTFSGDYSSVEMHIGPLYVATGARFRPYAKYRTTTVSSLTGGGVVENLKAGGYWPFKILSSKLCTFEGMIASYLRLSICGPIDLVGTTSTFMGECWLGSESADLGVVKIGYGAQTETSMGRMIMSNTRRPMIYDSAGRFRYLGTGENTDRDFKFNGRTNVLDSGATGGLWMRGRFFTASALQRILVLDGSNTVDSTLACAWDESGSASTYIAKKGTGTWKMVGTTNRFNKGVVAVEEGTLKFDSLAETNVPCSFGLSTRLAQRYSGAWNESKKADYAILLGSADAEGRLEWCGTNLWDNASSTRPVAVTGKGGRIVVNGPNRRIGLKGAFAADAGGGTLTLAGDASTNYLYNVSDGHGTMSLAKEGSGTWVLAGDQTFGGRLDVKAGELVVSSTLGTTYSWYRLTVKNTPCPDDVSTVWNNGMVQIAELGLYDSNQNRINRNLVDANDKTIPAPGEVSIWRSSVGYNTRTGDNHSRASRLFDETNQNPVYTGWCGGGAPRTNIVDRWIPIVMHVADGSARAASYDICCKERNTNAYTPLAWSMEASADGLFWDLVHEVVSNTVACNFRTWMSNGGTFTANAKRTGFVFGLDNGKSLLSSAPDQLANATVSVAPGAVLRAEGAVTLKSIAVDVAGAGTIDGFAIGEGGTLKVLSDEVISGKISLPLEILNATGTENFAGWSVELDGRPKRGAKVLYSNGELTVILPGMVFVVR